MRQIHPLRCNIVDCPRSSVVLYYHYRASSIRKTAALKEAEGWLRKQNPKYAHLLLAPFVLNGAWKGYFSEAWYLGETK